MKQIQNFANAGPLSAAALSLVVISLILWNLALSSPILSGDEYAYYAAAKVFPDPTAAYANDPMLQQVFGPLFAGLGHLLFIVSASPEALMKVVNSIAFGITAILFVFVAARLGVSPRLQNVALALFLLFPISSYTAYFMPEAVYLLLFWTLSATVVLFLASRPRLASAIAGVIVAAMFLTKSHALAVFASMLLTFVVILFSPQPVRPPKRVAVAALVLFLLATYVATVGLHWALTQRLELHPLAFIAPFYRGNLAAAFRFASWLEELRPLLHIALGHFLLLAVWAAPPAALAIAWVQRLCSETPAADDQARTDRLRVFVLIAFASITSLFAVAMTVNYTAQVARVNPVQSLHLHGRYYSFVIPLYFLVYLWLVERAKNQPELRKHLRWGAAGGLMSALLLFHVHARRIMYPVDYPEAFVFAIDHAWVARLAIGATAAVFALILWRGFSALAAYPALLVALFIGSNVMSMRWQHARATNNSPLAASARAVRALIPPEDALRGAVIGSERWGQTADYLFGLMTAPGKVVIRPAGARITASDLPDDAKWVVLTDRYEMGFPVEASLATRYIWFGRIAPGGPALYQNVRIWSGAPLDYRFGGGKWPALLEGFDEPEPWGVWSIVESPRIVLPELITGAVEIRLDGWVLSADASQPLEVRIGGAVAPVVLSDKRRVVSAVLRMEGYHREITLAGPKPRQDRMWKPPRGFALAGIQIRRAVPQQ